MQATLPRSDYVGPGCDCQFISVSQYLPGVIRVDGVINKGKLQVCKQPPPSGSSHPRYWCRQEQTAITAVLVWDGPWKMMKAIKHVNMS